jgi:hypothetical protein
MKTLFVRLTACVSYTCAIACGAKTTDKSDIQFRGEILRTIDDDISTSVPDSVHSWIDSVFFDALMEPELPSITRYSDEDLTECYTAVYRAAYYSFQARYVSEMQAVLTELDQREKSTGTDYARMSRMLVATRRFDEANRMIRKHHITTVEQVPAVTDISNGASPTRLVLDTTMHALSRQAVELDPNGEVVIVAHPKCHFSKNATVAIENDPDLASELLPHSIWISPQGSEFNWSDFVTWDHDHPAEQISPAFAQKEWPAIKWWSTPAFYFFRKGKLVTVIRGWPKGGRKAQLTAAIRETWPAGTKH